MVTETAKEARNQKDEQQDAASTALVVLNDVDDDLILAELAGRASQAWVYKLPATGGGEPQTGLTIQGVHAVGREMAKNGEALRVMDWDFRETLDHVTAFVRVGRYAIRQDGTDALLDVSLGTRREHFRKPKRNGGWYLDPTALEKAMSKAERNGMAKLLDEGLRQKTLLMALSAPEHRLDVTVEQQATATKASARATSPPDREVIEVDQARSRAYAVAKQQELLSHADIHKALGLDCERGKPHTNDQDACHALRDWIAGNGLTQLKSWEIVAECLGSAMTIKEQASIPPKGMNIADVPFE